MFDRNPRIIRLVALASVLMAFYPMPAGGGPSADLALGSIGILVGVLAYLAWPQAISGSTSGSGLAQPSAVIAPAAAKDVIPEGEPTESDLLLDHPL